MPRKLYSFRQIFCFVLENNLLAQLYHHRFRHGNYNLSERLLAVNQARIMMVIKTMIMVRLMVQVVPVKRKSLQSIVTAVLN